MGTPHALPKEHANAPIKYDVEELGQKEGKLMHKEIAAIKKSGKDAGDEDDEETKLQIASKIKLRLRDDKKSEEKKPEEKKPEEKKP